MIKRTIVFTMLLLSGFTGIDIKAQQLANSDVPGKVRDAMLCMQRRSWEQGTAMQALMEIGDTINVLRLAHEAVLLSRSDGRVAMCGSDVNISDPAVNGPGILFAYKVTGDEKYRKAAEALYQYYLRPETRTPAGNIRHNTNGMTVWSDNTFMQVPFLAMMGNYSEAIRQVEGLRAVLWNPDKKLYRHIYDEQKRAFADSSHWGGGQGWNAAGIAQLIDLLPKAMQAERKKLTGYVTELLDGCLAYQLPDGFFYDKVDQPNFVETTLAQMLAYTIYKGVKSGWLPESYLAAADKIRKASYSKIDRYGFIRDASSSPSFNIPGTSSECQAFFLLMEGAFNKLNK